MKRLLLSLVWLLSVPQLVAAQSSVVTSGASTPATCKANASYKPMYYKNGTGLYICTADNTWTLVAGIGVVTTTGSPSVGDFAKFSGANSITTSLFAVSGPATSTKTFTFPNANATVLTDNALVTAAQGGTGNGFFAVSGPASATKTFTFPNANASVLTDNAAVTVAQGGTGQTTYTKGDLLTAPGGATLNKLGVGSDGQVLSADAASTNGVKWATPGTGGGSGIGDVTHTGTLVAGEPIVGNGGAEITALSAVTTPQGRLTLTTGVPSIVATVTAQTTVYYTPAVGNVVPIYTGAVWTARTFSELSQATTDSTKSPAAAGTYSNYDIFVWDDSGTLRATRGPAWTQAQTFTVTIASPAVFSLTAHGFYECEPLVFSTSGALPTGLTAGTTYFVISTGLTANAFEVATSCGGAAVNTSGTQSGTHTATQNATVRGTGAGTTELEFVNGILMNKVAITNGPGADRGTYVGTIRTNGSSQVDMIFGGGGAAGGDSTAAGIWNMYNRRFLVLANKDTTASWNYTTAAYRIRNNNFNNSIQFVVGWQGDGLFAVNNQDSSNTSASIAAIRGIGLDSTVTLATGASTGQISPSGSQAFHAISNYGANAPLGAHYLAPLEFSNVGGTCTWYGGTGGQQNLFTLTTTF